MMKTKRRFPWIQNERYVELALVAVDGCCANMEAALNSLVNDMILQFQESLQRRIIVANPSLAGAVL